MNETNRNIQTKKHTTYTYKYRKYKRNIHIQKETQTLKTKEIQNKYIPSRKIQTIHIYIEIQKHTETHITHKETYMNKKHIKYK